MDEYRSVLREFFAAGVRFLVVGGYATIAHGHVRATDFEDLIANKEAVGRHKDLADVESLRAYRRLRER